MNLLKSWLFKRNKQKTEEKLLKKYGAVVWCKTCRRILGGAVETERAGHYLYQCECGAYSVFDFGPPTPILLSHFRKD